MVAGLLNLADVTLSALIDGTVLLGWAALKCFAQGHRGDKTGEYSPLMTSNGSRITDARCDK